MSVPKSLYTVLSRNFSSLPRLPYLAKNLSKIDSKNKLRAIQEAQEAFVEYLYCTRLLPFTYADHISRNALVSLSNLMAKVHYKPSSFSKSFQKFLMYNPINEFEFFFESIGIGYNEVRGFLPTNKLFFSEDRSALNAACALCAFGFPWNKLGMLYEEESSIFSKDPEELTSRLCGFKNYGFSNVPLIGICLAFPRVLSGELVGEIGALMNDLKRVFVDFNLASYIEGNVDAWYDICRKMRVFHDLSREKGKVGELMGKSKTIFLDYPVEVLVQKVDFFCRLGARDEDVGLLLLRRSDILNFDLETPVISVMGLLKHFGLSDERLTSVAQKYPHVLGRNKMANLPNVMRAMDLHVWFFNKIKDGGHQLLASYAMDNADEDLDNKFRDGLMRFRISTTPICKSKLDFLHRVGFGENVSTVKVLAHLHGTGGELQERFDCLLRVGIVFSKLCIMIRTAPNVLKRSPEILEQKVNYLCEDIGFSLECLYIFPAFLCFNLENRIKPRYKFYKWLTEYGLYTNKYSISSFFASSDKKFVTHICRIHPAAPKHWLECFLYQKPSNKVQQKR